MVGESESLLNDVRSYDGATMSFAHVTADDLAATGSRHELWRYLVMDAEAWDQLGGTGQAQDARRLAERVAAGLPPGCYLGMCND